MFSVELGYRFLSKFYAYYVFQILNLTSKKGSIFWNRQLSHIHGQTSLYQIQPYGSPWADENLQMITDNDDGSDYVLVAAILCNRCQKMTFKMITSDRRRNS